MIEIDVRGLSCPIPVVKTKQAIESNPKESILVITDSDVSKENVMRLASKKGYKIDVEETDEEYKLTLAL